MARLDQERQAELEPKRMEYAISELLNLGYTVTTIAQTEINFTHKNQTIKFFPYSGWFSGKGIGSGRGIKNLLQKLKS